MIRKMPGRVDQNALERLIPKWKIEHIGSNVHVGIAVQAHISKVRFSRADMQTWMFQDSRERFLKPFWKPPFPAIGTLEFSIQDQPHPSCARDVSPRAAHNEPAS